jgi:hypothetical protein
MLLLLGQAMQPVADQYCCPMLLHGCMLLLGK